MKKSRCIKNTSNTPYYLIDDFNDGKVKVYANNIYGDTNTPKKKTADIDKIEYLWKKRFGIDTNRKG